MEGRQDGLYPKTRPACLFIYPFGAWKGGEAQIVQVSERYNGTICMMLERGNILGMKPECESNLQLAP